MNVEKRNVPKSVTRRRLVQNALASGMTLATPMMPPAVASTTAQESPALLGEIVVDLLSDPGTLDPALTYAFDGWSIVHSLYDAPIQFGPNGEIQPLAAESFTQLDPTTFEIRLRQGLLFHDGKPVTSAAVTRAVRHLQASRPPVSDLFSVVSAVEEVDATTARLRCAEPCAWLPAQIAVWMLLLPKQFDAASLTESSVGSGPYKLDAYEPGNEVHLIRNEAYTWPSPKGLPLAERIRFRFVPEAATRLSDLLSGGASIIASMPFEQRRAIDDGGARSIDAPTVGAAWVRIATDTPPFDDARVRQALNHAVDVQAIIDGLLSGQGTRLASFYPDERALGFDPSRQPFSFDQERARQLLSDAGHGDGLSTVMDIATTERQDIAEAIAAMLGDVGITVELRPAEQATFNEQWSDPAAAPLRFATWRPLYDPHTLLSLVVSSSGFLSRYSNPRADELIQSAAAEPDRTGRNALYQQLGQTLMDEPAAIYLWNLSSLYGVAESVDGWSPRGDEYVIPTRGYGQA